MLATDRGEPLSVERERGAGKEIEVSFRACDELHIEVELDGDLNVTEMEVEDPEAE